MKQETTLTFYQEDNEQSWEQLKRFSQEWNEGHASRFKNIMNMNFTIGLEKDSEDYAAFMQWLQQPEVRGKVTYEDYSFISYEEADFQKADYIKLLGEGLPEEFIVNERTAWGRAQKCKSCGYEDPWSVPQLQKLIVDEKQLTGESKDKQVFNLDNGGLLLSKKAVDQFYSQYGKGITLKDVLNTSGKVSSDFFQLWVEKVNLVPDLQRTKLEGSICMECGVVNGNFESALFFKREETDNANAFSMHPNHEAMLFFRREIVEAMEQAHIGGFRLDQPAYI